MDPPTSHSYLGEKAIEFILVLILVQCGVLFLVSVSPIAVPRLGEDSGVFLYIGQEILNGKTPYVDVWDHKTPLIFYIDALCLGIFGNSVWAVWICELAFLIFSIILSYITLRKLFSPGSASLGVFFWLAGMAVLNGNSLLGPWTNTPNTFAVPFQFVFILAIVVWICDTTKVAWLAVAGISSGLLFLLRPNLFGLFLGAMALFLLLKGLKTITLCSTLRYMLMLTVGMVVPIGAFILYFSYKQALHEMINSIFFYNLYYSTNFPFHTKFLNFFQVFDYLPILFPIVLICYVWLSVRTVEHFIGYDIKNNSNTAQEKESGTSMENGAVNHYSYCVEAAGRGLENQSLCVCFALFSFFFELILIVFSGRAYPYYYLNLLPVSCILFAATVEGIPMYFALSSDTKNRKRVDLVPRDLPKYLIIISLVLLLFVPYSTPIRENWTGSPYYKPDYMNNPSQKAVVDMLLNTTAPNDTVLMWGAETSINFLARREAPSKYCYIYPLLTINYQNDIMVDSFLTDLQKNPPKVVVDTSKTHWSVPPIDTLEHRSWKMRSIENQYAVLPSMNKVLTFFRTNYLKIGWVGRWAIYRRIECE